MIPSDISQAQILGVSEALGNLTERGAIDSVIKVTVALSESGFAVVQDAVAYGEIKDESIAGTFHRSSAVLGVETLDRQAQGSLWWRSILCRLIDRYVKQRGYRCHHSIAFTV